MASAERNHTVTHDIQYTSGELRAAMAPFVDVHDPSQINACIFVALVHEPGDPPDMVRLRIDSDIQDAGSVAHFLLMALTEISSGNFFTPTECQED